MSKFVPDGYFKKVTDIPVSYLKENNIMGVLLDVDNTIMDLDGNLLDGIVTWCDELRENNISILILSNSNKEERLRGAAEEISSEYILFACKPLKKGFKKAKEKLDIPYANIAAIGDQLYTDVYGANNIGMFSILVDAISEGNDYMITMVKRPFEKMIKKLNNICYTNDESKERKC